MKQLAALFRRRRVAFLFVCLLCLAAAGAILVACSGDSGTAKKSAPKPPAGATLEIPECAATRLLGDGEITELTVTARDAAGAPLVGAVVLFVAPESSPGGSFEVPSKYGAATARVSTNAQGVATARLGVIGSAGVFLVDALLEQSAAAASFGISLTATKPMVSGESLRCQLEAKHAPSGSGKLLHGPVLLPAGASVTADNSAGTPTSTLSVQKDSWFAWVDEAPQSKYEHATRMILVDATQAGALPEEVSARYWPELALSAGAPTTALISAWRTHDFGTKAESGSGAQSVQSISPGSHAQNTKPSPGGKACAVIVYGLPDGFLRRDAELMEAFFKQRSIKVFAQRTAQGLLTPPTPSQIAALLDAAKADGCQTIYFYLTSHGGISGLDKISDGTGGKTTLLLETLGEMLTSRFAGTDIEVNPIIDACYSGALISAFQGEGLTGTAITAADDASESGAGLNYEGEINMSSYFSAALRECWRDTTADTDKSGAVSLKEAGEWTIVQDDSDVVDPKPQIVCLDPVPKQVPLDAVSIPCPGDEVVVPVSWPGATPITKLMTGKANTLDKAIAVVASGSEDADGWNTLIFDNANQKANLRLRGASPGTTTYSFRVFAHPFAYGGTAQVTVGDCGDGGLDAGSEGGPDGGVACESDPKTAAVLLIGSMLGGWSKATQCAAWFLFQEKLFKHSKATIAAKPVAHDHTTLYGRTSLRQTFTATQLDVVFGSGGAFPCGAGPNGTTLCAPGAPPVPAGDILVISKALDATIPIADALNRYQYGFVFDADNTPGNNYQANAQYADDLFKNTDRWYEANYAPASGWALKTSTALNGNIQPATSAARVIIAGNSITLVLPASEVASKAPYRLTAFRHTGDYGINPPYNYDGSVWPAVGQPLTPSP